MSAVNLKSLSPQKLRRLFASVDNVLCDNDGVLSVFGKLLPGVRECFTNFQAAGKRVKVITNNTAMGSKILSGLYQKQGFECPPEDIITPTMAISKYLKDINFGGKLWVMAFEPMTEALRESGFTLADSENPRSIKVMEGKEYVLSMDPDIKAIVLDYTLNATLGCIAKAVNYLNHDPEILLIFGTVTSTLPLGKDKYVIGAAHFQNLVVGLTKRVPLVFGKPSDNFGKYLIEMLNCNPSRTLFIGDDLDTDIGFAKKMGFKQLLVLTGVTKLEDIETCDESFKPDYYLSSIDELHSLLSKNQILQ